MKLKFLLHTRVEVSGLSFSGTLFLMNTNPLTNGTSFLGVMECLDISIFHLVELHEFGSKEFSSQTFGPGWKFNMTLGPDRKSCWTFRLGRKSTWSSVRTEKSQEIRTGSKVRDENSLGPNSGLPFSIELFHLPTEYLKLSERNESCLFSSELCQTGLSSNNVRINMDLKMYNENKIIYELGVWQLSAQWFRRAGADY
jgi:hypothetical protein